MSSSGFQSPDSLSSVYSHFNSAHNASTTSSWSSRCGNPETATDPITPEPTTAIGNDPPCAAKSVSISPKRSAKLVFFPCSSSPNPYELRWNRATTFDFLLAQSALSGVLPTTAQKKSGCPNRRMSMTNGALRASAMSRRRHPNFHAASSSKAGNFNRCSCLAMIARSSLRPTPLTISHVSHCDGKREASPSTLRFR
jgi:hypothetical protein